MTPILILLLSSIATVVCFWKYENYFAKLADKIF